MNPTVKWVFLVVFFVGMAAVVLSRFYVFFEQLYAQKYRKPFYKNCIIFKRKLTAEQLQILKNEFLFYRQLNPKQQYIFEHRVATFINQKTFVGREDLVITTQIKVLIAATAVMLTFGMRDYLIPLIQKIIMYPKPFFSNINNTWHKGETNPMLKSVVFSWEDFKQGYQIGNDSLNLGIHEFGHAIHLNAFSNHNISSLIFNQGFQNLIQYLQNNEAERQRLISTAYFRAYAYTNHYEFFAVLLENYIETPKAFKAAFPKIYNYMKLMLNFEMPKV